MSVSRRFTGRMFLALWTLTGLALAQESAAKSLVAGPDHQFADLHERLSETAENLLKATQAAPATPSQAPSTGAAADAPQGEDILREFAARYWDNRDEDLKRALQRVQLLGPTVEPVLREEGIPTELAAIVLVESAGRPEALSQRGARGLWQFIPETARRYGLHVGEQHDDRLDVVKSTRAAARYLRELQLLFQDWRLALAAYNAGEGTVQRAVARAGTSDFYVLSSKGLLPKETRNYVPAVLAATELLDSSGELALPVAEVPGREASVVYALMSVE